MKRLRNTGNFLLVLLVNMILNLAWTLPAWILLVFHFIFHWWMGWFWIALGLWLLGILLWMRFIRWAAKCGQEKAPMQENKNPYSQTKHTFNTNRNS